MKIVTFGGGSGQTKIIKYLKEYDYAITAVFSVTDSGGSTGKLRDELGVMPAGDLRRGLGALATDNMDLAEALEYRYPGGHTLGNLLLAGLEKQTGSFSQAVQTLEKIFKSRGRCFPAALIASQLCAELENGEVIKGETNIDLPKHDARLQIKRIWLDPAVAANPVVLAAVNEADFIIYCLGDLYSSLLPTLMVKGLPEALQSTKAKKIYTCNLSAKQGETHNFTAVNFLQEIEKYTGIKVDYLLANTAPYRPAAGYQTVQIDPARIKELGIELIGADLVRPDGIKIDEQKLVKEIHKLCQR